MREDARAVDEKPADGKRGRVVYEPIKSQLLTIVSN